MALFAKGCLILQAVLSISGCRPFEFSPYEVPPESVEGASSRTLDNLERIDALAKAAGRGFAFALLADSHDRYDALEDAVASINADSSIRFTVAAGDFTQYGLLREYEWFRDCMSGLRAPFVTAIGNHDALSNGSLIYRRMFGPLDYSFTYMGVRFVVANTNRWEFPFEVPDWTWLEAELAAADSLRVFHVSHVAPFGDQFDEGAGRRYREILARHRVDLSLHGHQHNFHHKEMFGDGVPYLVADDVGDRNYVKVTVSDTGVAVDRVWF
jgi:predicted phosphodiesterase